jgi:DNA-binding response OmpR family regulator/Flp pilus assembly protein TadD
MDQIKEFLKQLKKHPNRPDLHNSLGGLYQQKGDDGEASKHFLAAARLFSIPDSPQRNLNKAIAILKKMERDFPSHHDSYYLLAEILEDMENQDEAIEVYSQLSNIYRNEGKHLMAVSVFDKVLSFEPEDQEKWIQFATLNSDAGMPFHAAQAFVQAASLGLKMKKGEPPVGLVVQALKLDCENAEAHELFRTLAGMGETGTTQEAEILELAEEVDRNGQYEQALILLDLLKGTSLKEKAQEAAERVMMHSGFEETGDTDGQLVRQSGTGKFAGTKVLVVDDEREIVLLLEQILTGEGFHVFTAMDGQEGLAVYIRERPPLVVTDAMMPKLHGFELCRRIKEESDNTAKVMILTAVYKKYKYKGKVQEEYNVDEYLDKPFQITEFLQLFNRMAENAREAPKYLPTTVPEIEDAQPQQLSMLLVSESDADLAEKVTTFCQRHEIRLQMAKDPTQLVESLGRALPDIILITDALPGLESSAAARLLKGLLDLRSTTMVLITKDKSKLEGVMEDFNHRVFSPIDKNVLDNIVQIHRSSPIVAMGRRKQSLSHNEKRVDAVVRSKVGRILKSHSQLEEYYSTKVRELEEEAGHLREQLEKRDKGGD